MNRLDILAHTALFLGLGAGFVSYFNLRYNPTAQFILILLLDFFYLAWGFFYHREKKDLTNRLILEYLLIWAIVVFVAVLLFVA